MSKDFAEQLQRHRSYDDFKRYERQQLLQEDLRAQLKPPLGREPPLRLSVPDPPWKASHHRAFSRAPALTSRKPSTLRFRKETWDLAKTFSRFPSTQRPRSRERTEKLTVNSLPTFQASVSDRFQFAIPQSDSDPDFNPFLRPQAGNHFFPATLFFMDHTDYSRESWPKKGWSRWRDADEVWEWRECVITGFDPAEQRFSISWPGAKARKQVSRVNLRFEGEAEDEYLRKAAEATHRRDLQEAAFRIETRIEAALQQFPSIRLSEKALERILDGLRRWMSPAREVQIVEELQRFYRKGVVNFVFEIEHFVSKWRLTVTYSPHSPWIVGRRPRALSTFKSSELASYSRAVKSTKSWLETRTANHCLLQDYLKQVRRLREVELYGFITDRSSASSASALKSRYQEQWHHKAKTPAQISEEVGNDLFLGFGKVPAYTTTATRLCILHRLNLALQSEIERVIAGSLTTLVSALEQTYAVLPVPDLSPALAAALKPEFTRLRTQERKRLSITRDTAAAEYVPVADSPYGQALTSAIVGELRKLYLANSLRQSFAFHGPKPFFLFKLTMRHSRTPPLTAVKGKPPEEFFLPRLLRESKSPTSYTIINAHSDWISLIVPKKKDEESDSEDPQPILKGLRAIDRLGWTTVGTDSHSLQIYPSIDKFEDQLRELVNLPLRTILQCPKVTSVTGTDVIKCKLYQPVLEWAEQQMTDVLTYSLYGPMAMVALLRQYDYLLQEDQQAVLNSLVEAHLGDYAGLKGELDTIVRDMEMIQSSLPNSLQFGAVLLDLTTFKKVVARNGERLRDCLLEELQLEYSGLLHQSAQMFGALMQQLRQSPQTVEELQVVMDYVKQNRDAAQFAEILQVLEQAAVVHNALTAHRRQLTLKQLQSTWETKVWQAELQAARTRAQMRINKARPGFIEMVSRQSSALLRTLDDLHEEVGVISMYEDLKDAAQRAEKVEIIMKTLTAAQEEAQQINFRQRVLGMEETDFGDFTVFLERISKYLSLWTLARDWLSSCEDWTFNAFRMINYDHVFTKHSNGSVLLGKLTAEFANHPPALQVTTLLQDHISAFQPWVTLISKLRHTAIRDRHWTALLPILSPDLTCESLTLDDLMRVSITEHLNEVDRIYSEAINEFEVEKVINKVEAGAKDFQLVLMRDHMFRELPYVEGTEVAESAVMEQVATLTFILANSKYASVFRPRIERMKTQLTAALQIMKDVKELQSSWRDLYPLLQIQEIARTMDRERIAEVHDFYVKQAESICTSQSFAVFTETKIKTHVEANDLLDAISKAVEQQIKRMTESFPRLLFLSSKELRVFLGAVARRGRVSLATLYPGIGSVNLDTEEVREVTRSDFALVLRQRIPLRSPAGREPVEHWLQKLDASLTSTLKQSLSDLAQRAHTSKWWRGCPDSQLLSLTQHVLFAKKIFAQPKPLSEAIQQTIEELKVDLQALIDEIRPIFGTPGKNNLVLIKKEGRVAQKVATRTVLERLVLIVLQQMHVLNTALQAQLFDLDDLMWKAIFRLELDQDGEGLKVTIFDYTKPFGFEWQPLPLPLFVSTPITERCTLNLVCALKTNTCGLLHGGSGCSKSETLKELALMFGRSVLSVAMARGTQSGWVVSALIGCLATGTWACFEEVHQLEPMLLNALVSYLPKICEAQRVGKREVNIEQHTVRLQDGFAFWAMSTQPEVQLPARVLECFRCVSLVHPDLAAVAEVRLYALGLAQARQLSRRIARALTFLSDDCSSFFRKQTSLRLRTHSVKVLHRLINSMAYILDNFPVTDNNYLLSNAFARVLKTGLTGEEEALFEEFLTTVFRAPHNPILAGSALTNETTRIRQMLESGQFSAHEPLLEVMRSFWTCVSTSDRQVVLLSGPPASGKSTVLKTVAQAYSKQTGSAFNLHTLSGQVSHWTMFGLIKACSGSERALGFVCATESIGDSAAAFTPHDWVVIDTDHLDSDGLLAVARNEVHLDTELHVPISRGMRVIAEVETLASAAPSLLSEASTVYCSDSDLADNSIFAHEVALRLPQYSEELLRLYSHQYMRVIEHTEDQSLDVSRRVCLLLFCNYLCMFLSPAVRTTAIGKINYRLEASRRQSEVAAKLPIAAVQVGWILSLVTCVGRIAKNRAQFSDLVVELCKEEDNPAFAHGFLSFLAKKRNTSVYDVAFAFESQVWVQWMELQDFSSQSVVPPMPSNSRLFIETDTTKRLKFRIGHALRTKTDFVIVGVHQCGKSLILSHTLRELLSQELASIVPLHILPTTESNTVQHQVEEALDQLAPAVFGALGGRHHFVYIEDMNFDSNSIYDSLRFLTERGGWYSRGDFHSISGVSLCLVHSYSHHRYRPFPQRALRHFLLIYKYSYRDEELQTIFKGLAPQASLGSAVYSHYTRMRLELAATERSWQHIALANYTQALKWARDCQSLENVMRRYFCDQQIGEAKEPFFVLSELLEKDSLGFVELVDCSGLAARFEASRTLCNERYPESMKFFKDSLVHPEDQRARQLYHFSGVAADLRAGQHSIVLVERELQAVRALTYLAAETLGWRVYSTSLQDLTSELINSMAEEHSNYMATDVKFALRQILDDALIYQKTVLLITLEEDTDMDLPLLKRLFEFCCDLVGGKVLKLLTPMRKCAQSDLYADQTKQLAREAMQSNIVITVLIKGDVRSFERPFRAGPLHTLKHRYRPLYNVCRVVCYDRQSVPRVLKHFAETHHSGGNTALMKDLARVTPQPLEELALEQVLYLAHAIRRTDEAWIEQRSTLLQKAISRAVQCENEMEKSAYVTDLQSRIETLKESIQTLHHERTAIEAHKFDTAACTHSYLSALDAERTAFKQRLDACETRLHDTLERLPLKELLIDQSIQTMLLLGALQTALFPTAKPFPFGRAEKYATHCRKIITKIEKTPEKVILELMSFDPLHLPDVSEFMKRYWEAPGAESPLADAITAMETARITAKEYSEKAAELAEAAGKVQDYVKAQEDIDKKAIADQLHALSSVLLSIEEEIKSLEDKLQEVSSLRPRLQRVFSELKDLKSQWQSLLHEFEARLRRLHGDALLSAVFFVASLNLDFAGREHVKDNTTKTLSAHGIQYSVGSLRKSEDLAVSAFLRDSVQACALIWQLGLPYPVFHDPFSIAGELIAEPLVVVQYSTDLRKDFAFLERVREGGAVLLLEPTDGMLQTLMPLFQLRYSQSIRLMRQVSSGDYEVKLSTLSLRVHKDFHLYVSVAAKPPLILAQTGTVISLETVDAESWKTSILFQLSKMRAAGKPAPSGVRSDEEALELLANDTSQTIFIESFQPVIRVLGQRIDEREAKKLQVDDRSSDTNHPQGIYLELLAVASDLSSVLQTLKLGEWTVPPQVYRSLLLSACQEQIRETGFPAAEQVSLFTEPILYRFLVRLLWMLPLKCQQVVLLCYCLKRVCEEGLYTRIIRAVAKGLSLAFTSDDGELQRRWETLKTWFPAPKEIDWDSIEMRYFRFKDLFVEAKLPESLDVKVQAVLYCWFRQDLLPLYLESLVAQVFGRRFASIPDADFAMVAQFVGAGTPVSVFFKKTYPVPWLKQAAALAQVLFFHILPIASVSRLTNKRETKLESFLADVDSACMRKAWLAIEGLEHLNKNETERFCKHLMDAINHKDTHKDFRVWLLFEQSPSHLPAWTAMLNHTYRLCFGDPKTMKDQMVLTQTLFDASLYESFSSRKKLLYKDNSQLELSTGGRSMTRAPRTGPMLRVSITKQLRSDQTRLPTHTSSSSTRTMRRSNSNIPSQDRPDEPPALGSVSTFFTYNLAFIVCAFRLRRSFSRDLPVALTLKEVRTTIAEVLNASSADSLQVTKDQLFTLGLLFLQIVGGPWGELEFYAGLNFVKRVIVSRTKALKFEFTDDTGAWTVLKYPLYKLQGSAALKSVETLLLEMPKQDHLRLVGQPNVLKRKFEHRKMMKMVTMLPAIESFCDFQGSPLVQKVADLCEAANALMHPISPQPPTDFASLRVFSEGHELTKTSQLFAPDRYRHSDYRSSILTFQLSFDSILAHLWGINQHLYQRFFATVASELERISGYLTFRTAHLSPEDREVLEQIARDKAPEVWRSSGPYGLRREGNCREYLHLLATPQQFQGVIDFAKVFNPPALIVALLRACAFNSVEDIENMEFEVSEYAGEEMGDSAFLMDGLWLFNARLDQQYLSKSQNSPPGRLPVLKCTAMRKHGKAVVERLSSPQGLFLTYKRTLHSDSVNTELREERSAESLVTAAFNYIRTDWIESGRKRSIVKSLERKNKILCPVFPDCSATKIWAIFSSANAQGHWSKRGVKIDLP